jgi:hypothetical protein
VCPNEVVIETKVFCMTSWKLNPKTHVHRNLAATAGPRLRAAHQGPCPANRPGVATMVWLRPRAARRGPCPANRPRAAAGAAPPPRAAGEGLCPTDTPVALVGAMPPPRAASKGLCSPHTPAALAAAGPPSRAALAGARSARFAHNSLRPPFRIWWSQCSGAWHRG